MKLSGKSTRPPAPLPRPVKALPPEKRITSERIATDLAAYCGAGGRIEVLGVTRSRDVPKEQTRAAPEKPAAGPGVAQELSKAR
jgi:hypothetical protein